MQVLTQKNGKSLSTTCPNQKSNLRRWIYSPAYQPTGREPGPSLYWSPKYWNRSSDSYISPAALVFKRARLSNFRITGKSRQLALICVNVSMTFNMKPPAWSVEKCTLPSCAQPHLPSFCCCFFCFCFLLVNWWQRSALWTRIRYWFCSICLFLFNRHCRKTTTKNHRHFRGLSVTACCCVVWGWSDSLVVPA